MGANRRILFAVAGAAAIVLGSAGAGYGVYDAWQQEQTRSDSSMSDPHSAETNSDGSSTLRNSPSTGDRTTTPTPKPSRTTTDRDRPDSPNPDDSPSKTSEPDKTERDEQPEPEPTATGGQGEDSDAPEPSPQATAASSQESQFATEVVRLTNVERKKEGCDALQTDRTLAKAARKHSTDMAERDYFAHDSPDGTTPWKRMLSAGYKQPAAENIAKGQADPASVVDAWMDSSGHRRNMLDCSYEAVGVGVELDEGPYWTQNFGY